MMPARNNKGGRLGAAAFSLLRDGAPAPSKEAVMLQATALYLLLLCILMAIVIACGAAVHKGLLR